jgi:hypothetical protein
VRGAKEPVAVDSAENQKVAGRERHAATRGALEARKALVGVSHRLTLPVAPWLGKAEGVTA